MKGEIYQASVASSGAFGGMAPGELTQKDRRVLLLEGGPRQIKPRFKITCLAS